MHSFGMASLEAQMAALQIGATAAKDAIKLVYRGTLGVARFVQRVVGPAIFKAPAAEKTKEVADKHLSQVLEGKEEAALRSLQKLPTMQQKIEAFLALPHEDVIQLVKWTSTKVEIDRFPLLLERLRVLSTTAERDAECRELTALLADRFERPVFNEFMGMLLYFYPEAMKEEHTGTRFGATLREIIRAAPDAEIIAPYANQLARIAISLSPVKLPAHAASICYNVTGSIVHAEELGHAFAAAGQPVVPSTTVDRIRDSILQTDARAKKWWQLTAPAHQLVQIFCHFLIDQMENCLKAEKRIRAAIEQKECELSRAQQESEQAGNDKAPEKRGKVVDVPKYIKVVRAKEDLERLRSELQRAIDAPDCILPFTNKIYFPDLFAPQSPLFARIKAGAESADPVVQAHFERLYKSIA